MISVLMNIILLGLINVSTMCCCFATWSNNRRWLKAPQNGDKHCHNGLQSMQKSSSGMLNVWLSQ